MDPTPPDVFVEVYRADDMFSAQKIVDVVLVPGGVSAQIHDRKDQALPGIGQPGGFFIAVANADRETALGLVEEARQNGFIGPDEVAKV